MCNITFNYFSLSCAILLVKWRGQQFCFVVSVPLHSPKTTFIFQSFLVLGSPGPEADVSKIMFLNSYLGIHTAWVQPSIENEVWSFIYLGILSISKLNGFDNEALTQHSEESQVERLVFLICT